MPLKTMHHRLAQAKGWSTHENQDTMKAIFFKILSHKHLDIILDQIGTVCGQKKTINYNLTKNPPMILPVKNFSSGDSVNSVIHFL